MDSGYTRHMTFDRRHFLDYTMETGTLTLANEKTLRGKGKGIVKVPILGKMTLIADVLYLLGIGFNLRSIGQLAAQGMTCEVTGDVAILKPSWQDRSNSHTKGYDIRTFYGSAEGHCARGTDAELKGAMSSETRAWR